MNSITKKCTRCGEKKLVSEMGTRKGRASHSWCKKCLAEARKERYTDNPEKYREEVREYRKRFPEKSKAASRKWEANHPEWVKARDKKSYVKFVDKIKERVRIWNKEHSDRRNEQNRNRRALKRTSGEKITDEQWKTTLRKYGNKCLCCGRRDVKLTMDHVVPLKLGGLHIVENIQPLCFNCNSSKGARTIDYR